MSKIRLATMLLVTVAFFVVLVVHASSKNELQPSKVTDKAVSVPSKVDPEPARASETTVPKSPDQVYEIMSGSMGCFGGGSGSNNYEISINPGWQRSAIDLFQGAIRGDTNSDGIIDAGDLVGLVNHMYRGRAESALMESGDITRDGQIDVADVVYLLNYLYRDGNSPAW